MDRPQCPVCGGDLAEVLCFPELPVFVNVLADTRADALRASAGRQRLGQCLHCGFVTNMAFQAEKVRYAPGYHAERDSSPAYRAYEREIISKIRTVTDFRQGTALEVGCGTGEFLKALDRENPGEMTLVGVDPSIRPCREGNIRFDAGLFDEEYLEKLPPALGLLINRHMIEHIPNPLEMLRLLARALPRGGMLYLETPRLDWILEHGTFFDFPYEHCSYFTDDFMGRLLAAAGFQIVLFSPGYQNQYFSICAERTGECAPIEPVSRRESERIQKGFAYVERAYRRCREIFVPGPACCIWGCSGKGSMWVNLLDPGGSVRAVDINPYKQNKYILRTGNAVGAPETLSAHPPETILVMNSIYLREVEAMARQLLPGGAGQCVTAEAFIRRALLEDGGEEECPCRNGNGG